MSDNHGHLFFPEHTLVPIYGRVDLEHNAVFVVFVFDGIQANMLATLLPQLSY